MKYHLNLTIEDGKAVELLEPEIRRFDSGRSRIKISRKEGKGFVDIDADDATALRASIDSITQLLKVYEKMRSER